MRVSIVSAILLVVCLTGVQSIWNPSPYGKKDSAAADVKKLRQAQIMKITATVSKVGLNAGLTDGAESCYNNGKMPSKEAMEKVLAEEKKVPSQPPKGFDTLLEMFEFYYGQGQKKAVIRCAQLVGQRDFRSVNLLSWRYRS